MNYEEAKKHAIYFYISGSHQYGTQRENSDVDKRGVFIAPLKDCFEIFKTHYNGSGTVKDTLEAAKGNINNLHFSNAINLIEEALRTDRGDLSIGCETIHNPDADEELQELRKFLKLAADSNPNILEFLYVEDFIEIETPIWKKIKKNRNLFLSKKARYTYSGYCFAQAKRISQHRGYLLNPPSHKPTRKEFGLPEMTKLEVIHQNAILSLPDELLNDSVREIAMQEKRYASALQLYNSYQKWDKERNPIRKELERRFGFDTKHGSHLLRLSRTAKEILKDGTVIVNRRNKDADELRAVLNGDIKYEDLLKEIENLDFELDELYKTSKLQSSPDRKAISELYMEICEEVYGIKLKF